MELRFSVLGHSQPAGSKRAFARAGKVAVVDDNPRSTDWKQEVRGAAGLAMWDANLAGDLIDGPLLLVAEFVLARPQGHFGTGRNRKRVRPSAPLHPAVRPDTTKLLRAVEDALTGVVWRDDAQIVTQHATKRYGAPERVDVIVKTLDRHVGG